MYAPSSCIETENIYQRRTKLLRKRQNKYSLIIAMPNKVWSGQRDGLQAPSALATLSSHENLYFRT